MSWMHAHLILNHSPIVGIFLALLVMVGALIWSKRESFMVGCWLCLVSSLGGLFSYISGEETKELLEGFGIPELAKVAINNHEQAAAITLIMVLFAGSAAAGALLVFQKQPLRPMHKIGWLVALINAGTFASAAYTGYLGASITHQELNSNAGLTPVPEQTPIGDDELESDEDDEGVEVN